MAVDQAFCVEFVYIVGYFGKGVSFVRKLIANLISSDQRKAIILF